MTDHENLKLLFTGSEIDANVLKEILEENQIAALINNDMNSALAAGFGGSLQGLEAHVFVKEENFENAKILMEEFLNSFNKE